MKSSRNMFILRHSSTAFFVSRPSPRQIALATWLGLRYVVGLGSGLGSGLGLGMGLGMGLGSGLGLGFDGVGDDGKPLAELVDKAERELAVAHLG